jgi:hypothetical protein
MARFLTVDIDRGLDMWTFQIEHDVAFFPRFGYGNRTSVPCMAYIMAFGCKEEGKLHGSSLPIFLHIRIEVETGVIERTSPRGFHTDGVTLAIG